MRYSLIKCEINLILTWSANGLTCFIVSTNCANQAATFAVTDVKLYVSVITSSTQDNREVFEELKSTFKRKINCTKYQSKVTTQAQTNIYII